VYVDGTAVRKLQEAPAEQIEKKQNPSTSAQTKRNRERALQMNMGYVTFLTVAAVITMCVCVNFLKLQSVGTKLQKEVTSLETQLSAAVLENDSDYQRIMNSVDMEHVKDVAINELGMVYAKKSQIVTYEMEDNDYVRQYSEVPTE
jgi:cell division protein FtsL